MNRLISAGLMFGNLIEVSSPALIERYNRALKHLTGKTTQLTDFHIDLSGYSPEIGDEFNDPGYLNPSGANRQFILLTTSQKTAPLLNMKFSTARGILQQFIEANEARAKTLGVRLPNTLVLVGDAADENLLASEGIEDMDFFLALTNDDENNILSALLAKGLGAHRVLSLHVARPGHLFPGLAEHPGPLFRVPTAALGGHSIAAAMVGKPCSNARTKACAARQTPARSPAIGVIAPHG
jgi:hypothetical protein